MSLSAVESKIQNWDTIRKTVALWKSEGQKIIFTNGCFDILHYGHIHYLAEAKALGDKLIIGLNSEESTTRLKGIHRPINDDKTRLFMLAALEMTDAVVIFEEDTPFELIKLVMPDVLVKGGDYKISEIVGADLVIENGGEVKTLAFQKGYSTSKIEEKIASSVLFNEKTKPNRILFIGGVFSFLLTFILTVFFPEIEFDFQLHDNYFVFSLSGIFYWLTMLFVAAGLILFAVNFIKNIKNLNK